MKKSELMKNHIKLAEIKSQLRSKLFGIDQVIDQVVDSLASWYFFPENQTRPLVINLWGMTGVGKSDLVRQLVDLLDFENRFFQFDMGELGHDASTNIRNILSESHLLKGESPSIILLDEFQHCRSINESRNEVKQKEMRVIWHLLDTGKINYMDSYSFSRRKINSIISKFEYWVKEGMEVNQGMISSAYFGFFEEDEEESDFSIDPSDEPQSIFDKQRLQTIWKLNSKRFPFLSDLRKFVAEQDTKGIEQLLLDTLVQTTKLVELNFSNSVIFVVGNLDEAYAVSKDQSPDISPNAFHKITSEIKLPDIKKALLRRFRSEQIARLGNNHIIYPSLDEHAFSCIIDFELEKIADQFKSKTGLQLTFCDSLKLWLFEEGVIATQGVRPLKSSIKYGLEDLLPQVILRHSVLDIEIDEIHLQYQEGELIVIYQFNGNQLTQKAFRVNEKQKCLKVNRKDDLQALVAVHESGHAIAHLALFGEYPEKIKSVAAGTPGFVSFNPIDILNYETVKKRTCVLLAGYLAEKALFGFELVSEGSSLDIMKATELCMTFFKECGFSGSLIRTAPTYDYFDNYYHQVQPAEQKVLDFIDNAQRSVEQIFKREKKLLIQMARMLSDQTSLDKKDLSELVEKFGSEEVQQALKAPKVGYRERLFSIEFSVA